MSHYPPSISTLDILSSVNTDAYHFDDDNDMGAEMADEHMPSMPVEEPDVYESRPIKSRRIEQQEFGLPDDSMQCFGCEHLDDYSRKTTIPTDALNHLRNIGRECFGRMQTGILAKGMSDYYEKHIRAKINQNLPLGENPLLPWPPAKVLEHLRYHHQDPLVKFVILLEECEEARKEAYDRILEESTKTGRTRINSRALKDYELLTKLQLHIQSKDPTKMAFYSAGARMNTETLSQGVLSTKTKKLHDYFK